MLQKNVFIFPLIYNCSNSLVQVIFDLYYQVILFINHAGFVVYIQLN